MMTDNPADGVEFDDLLLVALAGGVPATTPRPEIRQQILDKVAASADRRTLAPAPSGFSFRYAADNDWRPHPVPGIRMKVLSMNQRSGYATLLLDVAAGTHFPAHTHAQAEECYVIAGSLFTCDRRLGPGDFVHADAGTEHAELYTVDGCQVLLVVEPEDYMIAG
jgi:quercetin dioxygenase-like cupin family protein